MNEEIQVFTDGSCLNNPGTGGYAICILKNNKEEVFTESEHYTTNNRMEIKAVLLAFEKTLKMKNVHIYTDSSYVVNGFNIWMHNWKKNQWKNKENKEVLNLDLWKKMYEYYEICINHKIIWVKGHNKNKYNELVNSEAQKAARLLQKTKI